MKLPNSDRAVVEIAKLRDYCLNPEHPRGKHKARVFAAALGLTADGAEILRDELLAAAKNADASASEQDGFGQRFVIDFIVIGPAGPVNIRSSWIIRTEEDFPRLTSCYVL
jgi:hypothetical protein